MGKDGDVILHCIGILEHNASIKHRVENIRVGQLKEIFKLMKNIQQNLKNYCIR